MQPADAVLMGRARLFTIVADRLPSAPVLGAGLGRITDVLETERAWLTNTHSDVLKHLIELGPVMFAVWIGCFYWTSRRQGLLALTVFMNVLFLSDNVSIYFDVMFPFYLSFAYLDQRSPVKRPLTVRRRPTLGAGRSGHIKAPRCDSACRGRHEDTPHPQPVSAAGRGRRGVPVGGGSTA